MKKCWGTDGSGRHYNNIAHRIIILWKSELNTNKIIYTSKRRRDGERVRETYVKA